MYIYIYVYIYIDLSLSLSLCTYIHIYIYIYIYLSQASAKEIPRWEPQTIVQASQDEVLHSIFLFLGILLFLFISSLSLYTYIYIYIFLSFLNYYFIFNISFDVFLNCLFDSFFVMCALFSYRAFFWWFSLFLLSTKYNFFLRFLFFFFTFEYFLTRSSTTFSYWESFLFVYL